MITIFTPTYNRAYVISKLYNSLLLQSNTDFEWIVIDDGSTDETDLLFQTLIAENRIRIRFFKMENAGKHCAINKGISLAKGEFFFIVDSDDYLSKNAVEKVCFYTKQIQDNKNFAGVSGMRIYSNGNKIGGKVCYTVLDTDSISFREKYHIKGDMAEVFKTDILKQYPFPEFKGEKFVSEGLVWSRIAQKYKIRYFFEGIYICDYLPDGLTKSIRMHHRNSPKGTMLLYNETMKQKRGLKTKIFSAINYWRYTIKYTGERKDEFAPVWWSYIFYPIGLFFYYRDSK